MVATFPLFSSLPPEIRNQIWWEALPGDIGPALYFYRKRGCWESRRITTAVHGYQHADEDHNLALDFRLEMLDHDQQFDLPTFFVSLEARGITRAWLETYVGAAFLSNTNHVSFGNGSAAKRVGTAHQLPASRKWRNTLFKSIQPHR